MAQAPSRSQHQHRTLRVLCSCSCQPASSSCLQPGTAPPTTQTPRCTPHSAQVEKVKERCLPDALNYPMLEEYDFKVRFLHTPFQHTPQDIRIKDRRCMPNSRCVLRLSELCSERGMCGSKCKGHAGPPRRAPPPHAPQPTVTATPRPLPHPLAARHAQPRPDH